jgi:hypothetical protein
MGRGNRIGIAVAGLAGVMLWPAASTAAAQTIVTSPGPDRVAVTVYRQPGRHPSNALDPEWPEGYALISETRAVSLPAGETELRFEGVAGGILPQSAVVSGLPEGIVERNRDAYLLSPGTLLDRSLGRRVHLRRTSLASGEVREQEAVIRSGADGAVVLRTADGFEALRCTGLSETLVYDEVPAGLSARPTLSVRARASSAVSATVTLTYLATGFDWQADYVATLSPDGDRVDLFAWLTLANGDETSFVEAETQAVAGRLNREEAEAPPSEIRPFQLQCWPAGRTSDIAEATPPPAAPQRRARLGATRGAVAEEDSGAENVIVTGSRIARQEELGDLKLYRIPEPVTVAANSQKQVALLTREDVRVQLVHRSRIYVGGTRDPEPANRFLITRNRVAEGLGLALPAGRLVLFAEARGRPILIGQGHVDDRAVGEDVEIAIGEATGVMTEIEDEEGENGEDGDWDAYRLTVSNDRAESIRFEAEFDVADEEELRSERRLQRRDGRPLWTVTVPANGTASLRYRVRDVDNEDGEED